MGTLIPRYIGIDETLSAFEKKAKTPYWSLWDKTTKINEYTGESMDESADELKDEIEISIKRNYDHPLTLKLHPNKEKSYTYKSETGSNLLFLCTDKPTYAPGAPATDYNSFLMLNEIRTLKSEIEALKNARINEEEENEEEEEENEGTRLISGINQMLDHPIISGLIGKWLNGTQPVRNLAGVDKTLEETINVLFSKGVTHEHLQKLAEMPEPKIKMLISML